MPYDSLLRKRPFGFRSNARPKLRKGVTSLEEKHPLKMQGIIAVVAVGTGSINLAQISESDLFTHHSDPNCYPVDTAFANLGLPDLS